MGTSGGLACFSIFKNNDPKWKASRRIPVGEGFREHRVELPRLTRGGTESHQGWMTFPGPHGRHKTASSRNSVLCTACHRPLGEAVSHSGQWQSMSPSARSYDSCPVSPPVPLASMLASAPSLPLFVVFPSLTGWFQTLQGFSLLLAFSSLVCPLLPTHVSAQKLGPGHNSPWLTLLLWITLAQRLLDVINRIWKQVDMSPKAVFFIQSSFSFKSRSCHWCVVLTSSGYFLHPSSASGGTDLKELWRINLIKPLIYSTRHVPSLWYVLNGW